MGTGPLCIPYGDRRPRHGDRPLCIPYGDRRLQHGDRSPPPSLRGPENATWGLLLSPSLREPEATAWGPASSPSLRGPGDQAVELHNFRFTDLAKSTV